MPVCHCLKIPHPLDTTDLPQEAIWVIKAPTLLIIGDSDLFRPEMTSIQSGVLTFRAILCYSVINRIHPMNSIDL